MEIAVLGGGFTGLTAAYYLAKKGHKVTLLEKEKVLGGLAVGFKRPNWDCYLERAYHHLLDSEDDILNFAKEVRLPHGSPGFSARFLKVSSALLAGKNSGRSGFGIFKDVSISKSLRKTNSGRIFKK